MEASPLATVGRALRWQHSLIWGAASLAVLIALFAAFVRDPTYQGTATLTIDESQNASQGFDIALQADQYYSQRYIDMATSRAVLNRVCTQRGRSCSAAALAKRVSATTTKSTGQVLVQATAPTAGDAALLANQVAAAILAQNQAYITNLLSQQRALLQQQVDALSAQMAATQHAIQAAHGTTEDTTTLASQLSLEQNQYQGTYGHLQDLEVQQTRLISGLIISQPAIPPAKPIDPDPVRYALVGLVGGLLVGFFGALGAERMRKGIMEAAELGEVTGCNLVLTADAAEAPVVMASYGLLSPEGDLPDGADHAQLLLVAGSSTVPVDELALDLAAAASGDNQRARVVPAEPSRAIRVLDEQGFSRSIQTRLRSTASRPVDLTIRCATPLARASLWLRPSVGPAVLVASRGRTTFREAQRTAELLRHVGLEPVAAVLLTRPGPARSLAPPEEATPAAGQERADQPPNSQASAS